MAVGEQRLRMEVRDAVEDDAGRVGELTGAPESVTRELVHDGTTRVAVSDDAGAELVGVVSFDAERDAVYVTHLAGTARAISRLLDEPTRFARKEDMAVEVLLEENDTALRETVTDAGFEPAGDGPRFEGRETSAFRLDPE